MPGRLTVNMIINYVYRRCLDVVSITKEKLRYSFNYQGLLVLDRLDERTLHLKNPSFASVSRVAPRQDLTSKQVYLCYQSRMFVNRLVTGANLRVKNSKHSVSKW